VGASPRAVEPHAHGGKDYREDECVAEEPACAEQTGKQDIAEGLVDDVRQKGTHQQNPEVDSPREGRSCVSQSREKSAVALCKRHMGV